MVVLIKKICVSPFFKQCFVTASVCVNVIGQGCMLGYPAILLPQLYKPDSSIPLTRDQGSWIASASGIMMLIGAVVMLPLMQCSRKTAHCAATVPAAVGWVITICATNFLMLIIGKVLCGLSFGMLCPLRSVLIGEYTSPKIRGGFLTAMSFSLAFGVFFVHLMGSILTWNSTAIICVFFSSISILMTACSPESPSWLAYKGRYDECRKVFKWLRGDDENEELEAMIQAQKAQKNVNKTQSNKNGGLVNITKTIRKKEFYKPITIMTHACIITVFSGCTIMAAYSTEILGHLMGPAANVNFWMVFLDAQRIVSNAVAVFVINRVRRRTMLFSVGILSILSHIAIAAYAMVVKDEESKIIWLPAVLVNIQIFAVAVGMMPVPDMLAGEVFPLRYKGIGGMICMIVQACCMFALIKTFPGLAGAIGLGGAYIVYAGILAYALGVNWFMLPETMGRTLQEIEDGFKGTPLAAEVVEKG